MRRERIQIQYVSMNSDSFGLFSGVLSGISFDRHDCGTTVLAGNDEFVGPALRIVGCRLFPCPKLIGRLPHHEP